MRIVARWRRVVARGSVVVFLFCASSSISIASAAAQDRPATPDVDLGLPSFITTVTLPQHVEGPIAEPRRPPALVPLYATLAVLQGLDMHSTMKGIGSAQGREANPIMQPVVENGAVLLAVKATATIGVIWMSEKMWK